MIDKLNERTTIIVNELVAIHKQFLVKNIPKELVDLVAINRGWDYAFTHNKLPNTTYDHTVVPEWHITDHGAIVLKLEAGAFTLAILFCDGASTEYGYPELKPFHCPSLRQAIGEIRALATVSVDVYIGTVTQCGDRLNSIIKQLRLEARCEDLNVTMVELDRIDTNIALTELLERMGRKYERHVLRSRLSGRDRPMYIGTSRDDRLETMSVSIKMGWLSANLIVNINGTYYWYMPTLNVRYGDIDTLISERFNHLIHITAWDGHRDTILTLKSFESRIVELATKILNYEELPEKDIE